MGSSKNIRSVFALAAIAAGVYLIGKNKNKVMSIFSDTPRGYRNNNPLNIRYSTANNWLGKVLPNTDGAFEQFSSMAYGYRAALYLFRRYINNGVNTVAGIVKKWAPETENNTGAYINSVCSITGYSPDMVLSAGNEQQLCDMAYAMSIVENGRKVMPDMQQIKAGWKLL